MDPSISSQPSKASSVSHSSQEGSGTRSPLRRQQSILANITLEENSTDESDLSDNPSENNSNSNSSNDEDDYDDDDDDDNSHTLGLSSENSNTSIRKRNKKRRNVKEDPMESFFHQLYKDHSRQDAKQASRKERKEMGYQSLTLVYGEICFGPFRELFELLKTKPGLLPAKGGLFVDIGSGSGRPVFAAALLHDFDQCIGIEILYDLHIMSKEVLGKWKTMRRTLPESKRAVGIEFHHDDAMEFEWSHADVVFCNSTCFDSDLMLRLSKRAEMLKVGAVVITATKRLVNPNFEVVDVVSMNETWGKATIIIHRKRL